MVLLSHKKNDGRKIIITIIDKKGIVLEDKIHYGTRPSRAVVETIKKILKHAAINRWITHADLFELISYATLLNIPRDSFQRDEWIQKELNEIKNQSD